MSYGILYGSCFVKEDDQFIPLIVTGSSNTYEASGRRARTSYVPKHLCHAYPFTTPEFITQMLASQREQLIAHNQETLAKHPNWGEYRDTAFGYYAALAIDPLHTSETSFQAVNDFYTDAFASARPLKESFPLIFRASYQFEQECKKEGKPAPSPQYVHADAIEAVRNCQFPDHLIIYGM